MTQEVKHKELSIKTKATLIAFGIYIVFSGIIIGILMITN